MEQQDRPHSQEEKIALEQTRGFSYTLEEIGTMVPKAKNFSFPCHELSMLPGPTQAGSVDVLPSYEAMTVNELFNGPSYSCPVYFGSFENKLRVLEALCNEIHSKVMNKWVRFHVAGCGLMPILKLSQTPRNKNKVFLCCSKNLEARCKYFQWIHEAPKPLYTPRTATDQP